MKPQVAYTTVEAVTRQLDKALPDNPPAYASLQDAEFLALMGEYVLQASDYITGECSRVFVPYVQTELHYFEDLRRNRKLVNGRLNLDDELLSASSIVWGDITLTTDDYRLESTEPPMVDSIRFNPSSGLAFSSNFGDNISIAGIWGYHPYAAQMYTTIGTVTIGSSSATSVTVAASSAYEIYSYVRCESELMQITAKPDATTLTVTRGVLGTTAASHSAKALERYNVPVVIQLAATRLASFLYEKRVSVGNVIAVGDNSVVLDALPFVVKDITKMKRPLRIGTP